LAGECSAIFFLVYTAPLFEEEGNVCIKALVSYIDSPFGFHRPRARAGFAADNDPVDAFKIDIGNRA
jgi:hypothetical protein